MLSRDEAAHTKMGRNRPSSRNRPETDQENGHIQASPGEGPAKQGGEAGEGNADQNLVESGPARATPRQTRFKSFRASREC